MSAPYFSTAWIIGMLVGLAVVLAIGVLVGGLLLRLSVRWVEGFIPTFGRSCLVAFLAMVIGFIANAAASLLLRMGAASTGLVPGANLPGMGLMLFAALVGFAMGVAIVALLVQALIARPDGSRIELDRAARVGGVYVGLGFVIYIAVIAVFLLLIGGVAGVMR